MSLCSRELISWNESKDFSQPKIRLPSTLDNLKSSLHYTSQTLSNTNVITKPIYVRFKSSFCSIRNNYPFRNPRDLTNQESRTPATDQPLLCLFIHSIYHSKSFLTIVTFPVTWPLCSWTKILGRTLVVYCEKMEVNILSLLWINFFFFECHCHV